MLSPSCPSLLRPQHFALPSVVRAHVCHPAKPADTVRTPVPRLELFTGIGDVVVRPLPNWPFVLDPQHHKAPEVFMTQV